MTLGNLWLSDFSVSLCLGKPTLCWMAENPIVMGISTTYVLASFWHFGGRHKGKETETADVGAIESWLLELGWPDNPDYVSVLSVQEPWVRLNNLCGFPKKERTSKSPKIYCRLISFPTAMNWDTLHFLTIPNGENHFPPRINSHLWARYVCVRDVMLMATNSSSGVSRSPLFPLKSPATMH